MIDITPLYQKKLYSQFRENFDEAGAGHCYNQINYLKKKIR